MPATRSRAHSWRWPPAAARAFVTDAARARSPRSTRTAAPWPVADRSRRAPAGIAIGPTAPAYAGSPATARSRRSMTSLDLPLSAPVGGFTGRRPVWRSIRTGLQGYVTDGGGSSVTVLRHDPQHRGGLDRGRPPSRRRRRRPRPGAAGRRSEISPDRRRARRRSIDLPRCGVAPKIPTARSSTMPGASGTARTRKARPSTRVPPATRRPGDYMDDADRHRRRRLLQRTGLHRPDRLLQRLGAGDRRPRHDRRRRRQGPGAAASPAPGGSASAGG